MIGELEKTIKKELPIVCAIVNKSLENHFLFWDLIILRQGGNKLCVASITKLLNYYYILHLY